MKKAVGTLFGGIVGANLLAGSLLVWYFWDLLPFMPQLEGEDTSGIAGIAPLIFVFPLFAVVGFLIGMIATFICLSLNLSLSRLASSPALGCLIGAIGFPCIVAGIGSLIVGAEGQFGFTMVALAPVGAMFGAAAGAAWDAVRPRHA